MGTAAAKLRTGLDLSQAEVESLFGSINELSNEFAASAPEILDIEQRTGLAVSDLRLEADYHIDLGFPLQ